MGGGDQPATIPSRAHPIIQENNPRIITRRRDTADAAVTLPEYSDGLVAGSGRAKAPGRQGAASAIGG
jgi:hypothetical protein